MRCMGITLKNQFEEWYVDRNNEKDPSLSFWLFLGDFLDDFYRMPNLFSVLEEPIFENDGGTLEYWVKPFIGAVCEHLCLQNGLVYPSWCDKAEYFSNEPFFGGNSKGNASSFMLN